MVIFSPACIINVFSLDTWLGGTSQLSSGSVLLPFIFSFLICLTDQVIFMLNEPDPESPRGKRGNIVRLESNNLLLLVTMRTKIALA